MNEIDQKNSPLSALNNVFLGKSSLIYVFKKISRISSAMYVISDFIKDTEPLKFSLRSVCNNFISKTDLFKDNRTFIKHATGELVSLRLLVELGISSKNISSMNGLILLKEIDDLLEILASETTHGSEYLIPKDFLRVDKNEIDLKVSSPWKDHSPHSKFPYASENSYIGHKGQINDKGQVKDNRGQINVTDRNRQIKRDLDAVSETSSEFDRRNQILGIIRDKGNITIKDISTIIKDCSEKTIQRELVALLASGKIKKTGERRWSRYHAV